MAMPKGLVITGFPRIVSLPLAGPVPPRARPPTAGPPAPDADEKTFLHKSLLTKAPYPPLRADFYKGRCPKAEG